MRTPILVACALVFVAAVPSLTLAASQDDFLAWAKARSGELDSRWDRLALSSASQHQPVGAGRSSRDLSPRLSLGAGRERGERPSGVSPSGFIHAAAPRSPFLPLSTRDRSGPSRGSEALASPAGARLNVPHSIRRPINSFSTQVVRRFNTYGDSVSRPRLKSFGRWSQSSRGFGGVQRPASRVDRPKKL